MHFFEKVPANGQAEMFNEYFSAVDGGYLVNVHRKGTVDLYQAIQIVILQQFLQGCAEIEDTLSSIHFGIVVIGAHKKYGRHFDSVLCVSFLEKDVVIFHKKLFL